MEGSSGASVSVVMPVFNGETTIVETLGCFLKNADYFDELIIIDDGSADDSVKIIEKILAGKIDYKLINHQKNSGLAKSYNDGIKLSGSDLIITVHQDITFQKGELKKIARLFENKNVVAVSHSVILPLEIWQKYNFWQKCFFSRKVGKKERGIDGKFDGFRRQALLVAGLFDEKHFHSAGEDGDMVFKLKKIGKVVYSDAEIVHLHQISPDFSWRDIIRKQKQYSEAQGALMRLRRITGAKNIARTFFREILVVCLLIPYVNLAAAALIIFYSFYYTKLAYLREYKNPRVLVLPFLNIFLLLVSLFYSVKGFIYGKQRI